MDAQDHRTVEDRTLLSYVIPAPHHDEPFPIGTEIDGYRILEQIGRGGMGVVYRARHLILDRDVAIKVLVAHQVDRADLTTRFLQEARALAEVSHAGIVAIHDLRLQGQAPYLVMELVSGSSLQKILEERSVLRVDDAVQIVIRIAEALEHAHGRGIVHRDLKPANILLASDGTLKVVDFGLAGLLGRQNDERLTAAGVALGTPGFVAPEQRQDPRGVDGRADLFSLGVILYQMLAGRVPSGVFQAPHEVDPKVPAPLSKICLTLMAQDRENRPASARVLLDSLTPWVRSASQPSSAGATSGPVHAAPPVVHSSAATEDPWADRAFLTALVGLILVCIAAFGILEGDLFSVVSRALVPLAAISSMLMGWAGLVRIRGSAGSERGARYAVFGMAGGFWLFLMLVLSQRFQSAPAVVFLARFPLAVAALSTFTLWDWLNRSRAELGTLFTRSGGRVERVAWLLVIVLPAVFLVPFIQAFAPEYAFGSFFFRWIAIAVGPVIYLAVIVLPGLKLR